MKDCLPWETPHAGAGCEEEGAAETTCDEPTPTPIPCPPALLGGEEVERTGNGVEPGRREGWREGVLRFGFTSHYSCFDLICSKLN